ncbi:polyphosphate kinase 2 family protein [Phycicoccus flavus]|uniref:polyphosphate kinase 2 family protein n=1 Tax=Phycicoccus flavus TaxID=2502783 RepID=UPI000FEC126F|nr:polyphosphate kinase 2 family protein [Phycicoccus flavus]NHA67688.1 polyphosphate kinase 2 family protein [Phycicoccus flavus]
MGKGETKKRKGKSKGEKRKGGSPKADRLERRAVAAAELSGKAAKKARKAKDEAREARQADSVETASWSSTLAVGPEFDLGDVDPRSTPGFDGKKKDAEKVMLELQERLSDLQERLYAESKGGGTRSVLLVIQGMDTAGKGGIMRHVVGAVDPQGVHITAFKAPSGEERRHPFLWRIRNALPGAGQIGVFDRSHYEDVLVVRVHDLVPRATWARRYAQINRFEESVVDSGTAVVKVMLHVSSDEQKERLTERLHRGDKYWKYNPGDVDERGHWAEYMEAYQVALEKCSTPVAPWHVVPADRKWYARLAVTNLLLEALEEIDPQWPEADFDVEAERERLAMTP